MDIKNNYRSLQIRMSNSLREFEANGDKENATKVKNFKERLKANRDKYAEIKEEYGGFMAIYIAEKFQKDFKDGLWG